MKNSWWALTLVQPGGMGVSELGSLTVRKWNWNVWGLEDLSPSGVEYSSLTTDYVQSLANLLTHLQIRLPLTTLLWA